MNPDRLLRLDDGRLLAVDHRGPPGARAVLFLHAAPGSRVLDPDPWATATAGVRLVLYDRAGYGGSTPLPAGAVSTVAGAAEDAARVLDELRVPQVAVVGWSAGGLVALALAAHRPDLVESVTMACTPAHESDVAHLPDEHIALIESLRPDLPSAAGVVAQALAPIAHSPGAMLDLLGAGPADDAVRRSQAHGPRLLSMAQEAVKQGVAGVAADIVASSIAPWGFEPADVTAPVHLWYGADDELVEPDHGAYWSGALPQAELTVVPGAGHLLPLTHWGKILAATAKGSGGRY
ncbi:MAG: alpha/beta fold hydrolase [Acidimicrobiia bacterium]